MLDYIAKMIYLLSITVMHREPNSNTKLRVMDAMVFVHLNTHGAGTEYYIWYGTSFFG